MMIDLKLYLSVKTNIVGILEKNKSEISLALENIAWEFSKSQNDILDSVSTEAFVNIPTKIYLALQHYRWKCTD